ncbi:MAG: Rnf-Nqr domain containing protein [Candidatus Omnitrophota bacterium]
MTLRKILGVEGYQTIKAGLWSNHPVCSLGLGICSALAITNKLENALAMGAGVSFVLLATALIISMLRNLILPRVRMITYMITISSFVIIVDRLLKAFYPEISEAINPYIGLIITNCIIMGRAEAFYIRQRVSLSLLDALANGISYTYTLIIISIVRELFGFGTLLGIEVMPRGWINWTVMSMAPGAFFLLAVFLWIMPRQRERKQ